MSLDHHADECREDLSGGQIGRTRGSTSMDGSECRSQPSKVHAGYQPFGKAPPLPHHSQAHPRQYHSSYQTSRPTHELQAAVTSSFSVDDERDDHYQGKGGHAIGRTNQFYGSNNNQSFHSSHRGEEVRWARRDEREVEGQAVEERIPPLEVQGKGTEERIPPPRDSPQPIMIPPSPPEATGASRVTDHQAGATRPTGCSISRSGNLKRSFWHHSTPNDQYRSASMHPAFIPPKRMKFSGGSRRELPTLTPRAPVPEGGHVEHPQGSRMAQPWYRTHSWGAQDQDPTYRQIRKTRSFPAEWTDASPRSSGRYELGDGVNREYGPGWGAAGEEPIHPQAERLPPPRFRGDYQGNFSHGPQAQAYSHPLTTDRNFDRGWQQSQAPSSWRPPMSPPTSQREIRRTWNGPSRASEPQNRDDTDVSSRSPREINLDARRALNFTSETPVQRQVTFESNSGETESMRHAQNYHASTPRQRKQVIAHESRQDDSSLHHLSSMTYAGSRGASEGTRDSHEPPSETSNLPLRLLAQPEDRISLSETLCTIRENIEVFTATTSDVEAPAPGRKHPVVVGQVGLRCIHCRHTTKSSDRVKRAVCYPSSIKRIYRTVIDMKLDHFQHCRFVPTALKDRLDELKAINTRSTGTTMQYFLKAAMKMGMFDGQSGVRLVNMTNAGPAVEGPLAPGNSIPSSPSSTQLNPMADSPTRTAVHTDGCMSPQRQTGSPRHNSRLATPPANQAVLALSPDDSSKSSTEQQDSSTTNFTGKIVLALPEDKMALSPLRCFLRENVCAFSATEEDIAVRTPTTFSVVLGQVGIGCIHCHSLPAKERSNRAVCFPFSIGRIYQSVADIQRFHLGECKMVPQEVRQKFLCLQSASSKGSKGLATRQYWVTSARKIGLTDTPRGIRFARDPSAPSAPAISLDILAQVASNVTTVSRPLVLPEDRACIAEFLYVVMEQLQPCRFTEADRNKRRLKDVGCIGVECKHCAGQVESRKFFWSSVNAVESNFVSVHTHMMECRLVPDALKKQLAELKQLRKEQTGRLKTGSQKAFFARVWKRLHGDEGSGNEASTNQNEKLTESEPSSKVEVVSDQIKKMSVVSV